MPDLNSIITLISTCYFFNFASLTNSLTPLTVALVISKVWFSTNWVADTWNRQSAFKYLMNHRATRGFYRVHLSLSTSALTKPYMIKWDWITLHRQDPLWFPTLWKFFCFFAVLRIRVTTELYLFVAANGPRFSRFAQRPLDNILELI